MITAIQGLKETIQQIRKLEAWLDRVKDQMDPKEVEMLEGVLRGFRSDIENILQEAP